MEVDCSGKFPSLLLHPLLSFFIKKMKGGGEEVNDIRPSTSSSASTDWAATPTTSLFSEVSIYPIKEFRYVT